MLWLHRVLVSGQYKETPPVPPPDPEILVEVGGFEPPARGLPPLEEGPEGKQKRKIHDETIGQGERPVLKRRHDAVRDGIEFEETPDLDGPKVLDHGVAKELGVHADGLCGNLAGRVDLDDAQKGNGTLVVGLSGVEFVGFCQCALRWFPHGHATSTTTTTTSVDPLRFGRLRVLEEPLSVDLIGLLWIRQQGFAHGGVGFQIVDESQNPDLGFERGGSSVLGAGNGGNQFLCCGSNGGGGLSFGSRKDGAEFKRTTRRGNGRNADHRDDCPKEERIMAMMIPILVCRPPCLCLC